MKPLIALCMTATLPALAFAMSHGHSEHHQMHQDHLPSNADSREIVEFPAPVYEHTLKSMREHLEAIHTMIEAVASEDYAKASLAAEKGLGIGHQHGPDGLQSGHAFMPMGMRQLGHQMHMNARELVVTLNNAEVTGDTTAILNSVSQVTQACVSCHRVYQLKKGDD